jgi:hypothetical protein
MQKIRPLAVAVLLAALTITGCTTSAPRDPVKVEQVKAAILPLASSAVRRVVVKNPDLAPYLREVGTIFGAITDTQRVNPQIIASALEAALVNNGLLDPQDEATQAAIDFKNVVVAIYAIYHAERLEADVSEHQFLLDVLGTIALAINQGLNDAGL